MKGIKVFLRSRATRLALLLVVFSGVLGLIPPGPVAQSAVCAFRPVIRTYYSDSTYTNVVGQRGLNCNCDDISWGVTSAYVVSQTQCCPHFTC